MSFQTPDTALAPVHSRWRKVASLALLLSLLVSFFVVEAKPAHASPSTLASNSSYDVFYARAVRLSNGNLLATVKVSIGTWKFYTSSDEGTSWSLTSTFSTGYTTEDDTHGECCEALYVFPQQLGSYSAGTVLFAYTSYRPGNPTVNILRSTNNGASWTSHSTAAPGPGNTWEPEFTTSSSGSLVLFYSDERQQSAGYSQTISHQVSTDGGVTWGSEVNDIAITGGARPGMARVARLGDGTYVMAFEAVNIDGDYVHVKTSSDGVNWGSATDAGTRVSDGTYAANSTSSIAWIPEAGNPKGALVVAGRGDGSHMFVSHNGAAGPWSAVALPFTPQSGCVGTIWCNYSPTLLPVNGNTQMLLVTGAYNSSTGLAETDYGKASVAGYVNAGTGTSIGFTDRPSAQTSLTGSYANVGWGSQSWMTGYDSSNATNEVWINNSTTSTVSQTFTLPAGATLSQLKIAGNGSVVVSSTGNPTRTFKPTSYS